MGNAASGSASAANAAAPAGVAAAAAEPAATGCPMKEHAPTAAAPSAGSPPPSCPHAASAAASTSAASPTVTSAPASRGTVYNVYAQPIDPSNQMPVTANQEPSADQRAPLSTSRQLSSIRKGGTDGAWLYPSPQMFWNALVRKQKAENVDETDMEIVVKIHNEMNERAWSKLQEWEALHAGEHLEGEPALRRFMGNPYVLSPKARIKSWLGYGFPFDRHDWYVDRAGAEVHYIIDYYYCTEPTMNVAGPGVGGLEPNLTRSIHVDVRPALDSLSSAFDRLRRFPERALLALQQPRFFAEGLDPSKAPQAAAAFALSAPAKPAAGAAAAPAPLAPASAAAGPQRAVAAAGAGHDEDDAAIAHAQERCGPKLERLRAAPEAERGEAHVAFNYCLGTALCPSQAAAFLAAVEATAAGAATSAPERTETAFAAMTQCVFERMQAPARRAAAGASGAPAVPPLK